VLKSYFCAIYKYLVHGVLQLVDYHTEVDLYWEVAPECPWVNIWSEQFYNRFWSRNEYFIINGTRWPHRLRNNDFINHILPTGFSVAFSSQNRYQNQELILKWRCLPDNCTDCLCAKTDWGEWSSAEAECLPFNGTCGFIHRYRECPRTCSIPNQPTCVGQNTDAYRCPGSTSCGTPKYNFLTFVLQILLLGNGTISLLNYSNNFNAEWHVHAECEYVQIQSDLFKTQEGFDIVTISDASMEKQFSGKEDINDVLLGNFSIRFVSNGYYTDDGFVLVWECDECTGWGEWIGDCSSFNGTCGSIKRFRECPRSCSGSNEALCAGHDTEEYKCPGSFSCG